MPTNQKQKAEKNMAFFIIAGLIYIIGNIYIFHHLWIAMPAVPIARICLIAFASIVVLSFFLFYAFSDSFPIGMSRFLYAVGTSWLMIMLYFVIVFLVKDAMGLANRVLHFMPSDAITRYTRENWVGLAFMIGFIVMLMVCGYLKYTWKVRVETPIALDKPLVGRDSLKIVAVSDIHLGYGIGKKEFEKSVKKINAENADLILIAGDIIDSSTRPLNEEHYEEVFKKLNAPVYACLGNHEYISGISQSIEFLKKTGINLLRDSHVEIDSCLYIIGRDDRMNSKRKTLEELTAGLDKSKPIILLDHQPYNLSEPQQAGIDLQLSGHTHQGQIFPISLITNAIYEIDHGYSKFGDTNVIVSSGLGIWGGKFRIGTQSEYIVITLKGKK